MTLIEVLVWPVTLVLLGLVLVWAVRRADRINGRYIVRCRSSHPHLSVRQAKACNRELEWAGSLLGGTVGGDGDHAD